MKTGLSAGLALLVLGVADDALAQAVVRNLVIAADPQPFTPDDLLWMEVRSGELLLTDSLNVYSSRAGVFVPLGELSRVLDLAVGVFPAQRRAEGWVLSPDRQLIVDLAAGRATVNGRVTPIAAGQAAFYGDDLYVRLDLLQQLLPLQLRADPAAQVMELTPTEPLPFQQREARLRRQAGLGLLVGEAEAVALETPYRPFTPPAFDVNIGGQLSRDGSDLARRYDVRAAGDLLWAGFEGYVGSDDRGDIGDVRVMLTRKDPGGRALGLLGGTRAGLGDVFSPSMAMGAAGYAGRGVFYTSAPLESLDLATPLNLRGELALGEEVELYVNEVLQAAQTSPIQGRYEFLNVPLAYGLNTIRLVFYGSQGQSREVVRRINFGSGQLEPGRLALRFGAVEQGAAVFDVGQAPSVPNQGRSRIVATAEYGLTPALTLAAGAARYSPETGPARTLGSLGLRGSLGAAASQLDLAFDDQGGSGVGLGLASRVLGVSAVGRHAEYSGGFVDETRQLGVIGQAPLRRATDLRLDGQARGPGGLALPVSFNLRRLERIDARALTNAELRASAPLDRYYVSSSVVWEDERGGGLESRRRLAGATDAATLVASTVQVRGGLSYVLAPDAAIESAYVLADWQTSRSNALRFGAIRTLGPNPTTSLQASNLWRASRFDLAFNVSYETASRDWRIGLQMGFGFGYDPFARGYRFTRPGAASGGAVAVNAYVDDNGDGVRQADEIGVADIVVDIPGSVALTDDQGRAFVSGLGDGASARIRLDGQGVDDPFLTAGPPVFTVTPRAGRVVTVDYPMRRSAELELTIALRRSDGSARPLSAVNLTLVPEAGGEPLAGRSDHAGVLFLEGVRPGAYRVVLDQTQAAVLGLELVEAPTVVIPPSGGFVRAGEVVVRLVAGGS
ncbi:hypothetical protein E4M02_13935 [Brevundimonas sp. S30B]|uniref:hypothetical protein n=1 Tax=unclassified Brevundimonas TaxID=2622653 RepID=UPI001072DB57|nr:MULTISPECIES: hypothetical protein [unclassified Brevundimonas]QBX37689.1 hypothetical protein E4M01_07845 [Brevundimonas sp. MF30-B]TFW00553.1 hypothetical protein E4M02_13935 [Brevundimonas sp. S30B]